MKKILSLLCCLLGITGAFAAGGKPNVIFIVADDLGYGEPGCYGGHDIPTPNIDTLAASGVRFTSGYVTAPFCAASRAAMLTGRYQTRFGFEFNPIGAKNSVPGIGLPLDEKTLAEQMRDAGYATALIGKWHLGGTAPFHPQRRGFDEFFGFLHEGHFYVPPPGKGVTSWLRRKTLPDGSAKEWISPDGHTILGAAKVDEHPYDADNPLLRGSQPVDERENLTDAFTREACDFIERHKSQPFYLHLAYNAVHQPMQGADAYMAKFAHIPEMQRRVFAAMLAHLDDGVGRLLAKLRTAGLEENTLIVFISDNGGPTQETTSINTPLRGEKGQLLEGGIRIPLMLQWKGKLPAGRVEARTVSALDLLPTALAAAGAKLPAKLDGVDLLPHLAPGDTAPIHARLYWRVGAQDALREGDWKIHRGRGDKQWQLYNLAADIAEAHDLAAEQPVRVAELEAAWKKLDSEMIPPLWTSTLTVKEASPDGKTSSQGKSPMQ